MTDAIRSLVRICILCVLEIFMFSWPKARYLWFPELSVVTLIKYSSSRNSRPSSFLSAVVDIHCITQDLRKFKVFESLVVTEKCRVLLKMNVSLLVN